MALVCERCDAGSLERDDDPDTLRLTEVSMNFGVTTVLCLACRQKWTSITVTHELFREYTNASFLMRCWQTRWRKRPGKTMADATEGLTYLDKLSDLDIKLMNLMKKWIDDGEDEEDEDEEDEDDEDEDFR